MQLFSESFPEALREYLPVIEGIADHVLHLLFEYPVEVIHRIVDYLLLLRVKLFFKLHLELFLTQLRPLFQIGHFVDVGVKARQSLRF